MHPEISSTTRFGNADNRRRDRERNKLHKRLLRQTGQAIADFSMIGEGDKVMVCLSGGKDSYALLDLLLTLRQRAPIHFDIVAVNLDQKQPGFPEDVLPAYLDSLGVDYHIENQDTYSIVTRVIEPGKTMCSLCSRLRRGILYRVATELGATRIALGHHRDDIIETFFLNLFYGGKLKSMPPKLVSDDGAHVVIRPLAYVSESDLVAYADWRAFPIIPCNLCGSQDGLKRAEIKQLMQQWQKQFPGRIESIFGALGRVAPSHLLDDNLFDFASVAALSETDQATQPVNGTTGAQLPEGGDTAFDPDPTLPTTRPAGQDAAQSIPLIRQPATGSSTDPQA
jgi:tRNA 2-thiocytidine biosynthesis protein TtcA